MSGYSSRQSTGPALRMEKRIDWLGVLIYCFTITLGHRVAHTSPSALRAHRPVRTEHYLERPVKLLTMISNDTKYEDGLHVFEESLNRTRGMDTPMELEVIRTTAEDFQLLGWKAKILYALKSLRSIPDDQLVIWADSKDTIFLPCGRDLRRAFQGFRTDIVLGGYPFQFPDAHKSELFPEVPLIHPEIPFPTYNANYTYFNDKFINAGIIIGRSWALLGGVFLRYQIVDMDYKFNDQAYWANMYLAQFYDNAGTIGMHPTIAVDSGYLLASQGAEPYSPVGDTGYWQCDRSRFTACIIHASGADNFIPLREQYHTSWSKSTVRADTAVADR